MCRSGAVTTLQKRNVIAGKGRPFTAVQENEIVCPNDPIRIQPRRQFVRGIGISADQVGNGLGDPALEKNFTGNNSRLWFDRERVAAVFGDLAPTSRAEFAE